MFAELLGVIVIIGLVILVIVLPVHAVVRAREARREAEEANLRIRELLERLGQLQQRVNELATLLPKEKATAKPAEPSEATKPRTAASAAASLVVETPVIPAPPAAAAPPPSNLPPPMKPPLAPSPPPLAAVAAKTPPSLPQAPAAPPALNFEQFMGAKLFAWIGGLALFLGILFFVKYAFERNLIPPAVRVTIGFLTGAALLTGGVLVHRRKAYVVLGQTLCASGTLILYGVTFAAHALYKFPAFGPVTTFLVMSFITAAAFVLAVRLNALVIAILGMAGGFLTPLLVATGEDRPFSLFGYIALLDLGLLAVAKQRRWLYLAALAAAGTLFMQAGWLVTFFNREGYEWGAKSLVPFGILGFFVLLFLAASWWSWRRDRDDLFPAGSLLGLAAGAMLCAFVFLQFEGLASRPGLLHGFVFFLNAAVLAAILIQPRIASAQPIMAAATFVLLAVWTNDRLDPASLPDALLSILVFGFLHSIFPVVWRRFRPHDAASGGRFSPWITLAALALLLLPVLQLDESPLLIWMAVLVLDLVLIILAAMTSTLAPLAAALLITFLGMGLWLFKLHAFEIERDFLLILAGFAVVFALAGCWLARRFAPLQSGAGTFHGNTNQRVAALLPPASAVLPFMLLIMAVDRLPLANPSPIFAVALLLVLVLLGLAKFARQPALCLAALGCVLALQHAWHFSDFTPEQPWLPLVWHLGFAALFLVFPFLFRTAFHDTIFPWATSALSGIGHFWLVYEIVKRAFPNDFMGLLPAAFVLPPLVALAMILRTEADSAARTGRLAWFGGAALFFITLIFPIQFERQWLTLGWALEGAALCWLFQRVPHHGLRWTGGALLAAAFARLAVNPAVLTYQPRSEMPILNWHLYTYGLAALALFAGARWLRPPHHRLGEVNARAALFAGGGILLFLLLNIEIADFFTAPGTRFIAFEFSGHFARDMTYSIAWALFAFALISLGLWRDLRGARYAGLGLLAVTLLKLFFHDLAAIGNVYRIAALLAVAVIALAASFLYQRFFDRSQKS